MGLRETLNKKKSVSIGGSVFLFLLAGSYLVYSQWPERRSKGDKTFYTVDDGQTWFLDSIYKTPPFDQDGKTAVRALVYSYNNGHKTFCPVVERYDSDMKKRLDDAVAQANRDSKPLSSIALFGSRELLSGMEVKQAGPGHNWVSRNNVPEATKIFSAVQAPDGSDVDAVVP